MQDFTLAVGATVRADYRDRRQRRSSSDRAPPSPRRSTRRRCRTCRSSAATPSTPPSRPPASSSRAIRSSSAIQDQTNASYLSLGGGPRRATAICSKACRSPTSSTGRRSCRRSRRSKKCACRPRPTSPTWATRRAACSTRRRDRARTRWHGSALVLDKPGWAPGSCSSPRRPACRSPPQYFRNWAGSLGGPILKNRTFFWFSTDSYEQLGTRNNVLTLPTALERARRLLADPQCRRPAGHHLRSADDTPERRRPVRPRSVSGQRDSAGPHQPGRPGDARDHADSGAGKSYNGVASLLDGPQYQQTLKLDQRWNDALDDHRHVCAAEDARAGLGLLRRVRRRFPAIRTPACCSARSTSSPSTTSSSRTTRPPLRFAMATTTSYDSGSNFPAFDAAHARAARRATSTQLTYNTFPAIVDRRLRRHDHGRQHRAEQHHPHHSHGQRDGLEARWPSHAEVRRRVSPDRRPTSCSTARRPARSPSRRRYTQAEPDHREHHGRRRVCQLPARLSGQRQRRVGDARPLT